MHIVSVITNTQLRNYCIIAQYILTKSGEDKNVFLSRLCETYWQKGRSIRALFISELGRSDLEQNPLNLHLMHIQNYFR